MHQHTCFLSDADAVLVELLVTSAAAGSAAAAVSLLSSSSARAGHRPTSWLTTDKLGASAVVARSSRRVQDGALSAALQMARARQERTALSGLVALADCTLHVESLSRLMMLAYLRF